MHVNLYWLDMSKRVKLSLKLNSCRCQLCITASFTKLLSTWWLLHSHFLCGHWPYISFQSVNISSPGFAVDTSQHGGRRAFAVALAAPAAWNLLSDVHSGTARPCKLMRLALSSDCFRPKSLLNSRTCTLFSRYYSTYRLHIMCYRPTNLPFTYYLTYLRRI